MTGINHLPTVPVQCVDEMFAHEVAAGVPRSQIGKGVFAYGSLVKVVARQGLNVVDGDQRRAFIQNRYAQVVAHGRAADYPTYGQYLQDPEGWCEKLRVELHLKNATEAKRKVIVCSNKIEMVTSSSFAASMVRETRRMAEYFAELQPDTFKLFAECAVPLISFLSALDWNWEHEAPRWSVEARFVAKVVIPLSARAPPGSHAPPGGFETKWGFRDF